MSTFRVIKLRKSCPCFWPIYSISEQKYPAIYKQMISVEGSKYIKDNSFIFLENNIFDKNKFVCLALNTNLFTKIIMIFIH